MKHFTNNNRNRINKLINVVLLLVTTSLLIAIFISCALDASTKHDSGGQHNLDDGFVVLIKDTIAPESLANELNAQLVSTLEINGKIYANIVGDSLNVSSLEKHKHIVYAEPNHERHIFTTPNDTLYTSQYAPALTGLEPLWDAGYTGKGVVVAVVDTGVNTLHEDFDGATAFIEGADYEVDPSVPYKTTHHLDVNGHGTHVAGIIAARRNNNKGIVGVAPEATIMPLRASTTGRFSAFKIASSVKKAADLGADIINMSYGGFYTNYAEYDAIQYALEKGVILVAASGNNAAQMKSYPASYPGIIAVGASNGNDRLAYFSTWSPLLSVVAPGEEILSLKAGDVGKASTSYVVYSGTSMAAPFVAGVVALLKQKFSLANSAQIKSILETTALDLGDNGFDIKYGYGRVRPKEALATVTLPDTQLHKVDFSITAFTNALSGYPITLLNVDSSQPLHTIITNLQGNTSAFLTPNTYQFTSSYMGISYKGSFTLPSPDNNAVTLSKNFENSDFENGDYYRISIYSTDTDSAKATTNINDTTFSLWVDYRTKAEDTVDNNLVSFQKPNYNLNTETHKSVVFKALARAKYAVKVHKSSSSNTATWNYRIIVEKNNPVENPTKSGTASADETNDGTEPEDLILVVDSPRVGKLSGSDDIDYFVFTTP